MSYRIVQEIINESLFNPQEKLVMISLGSHANDKTRTAWPSINLIVNESSLSERTVQRHLRQLEKIGIITAKGTRYGGTGNSTHYQIAPEDEISKILVDRARVKWQSKGCQRDRVKGVSVTGLRVSA